MPPLRIHSVNSPQIGDKAPDFTAPGFDDQPLHLNSFRGKYVLPAFWATWRGSRVGESYEIKKVYDKFGADPRFVMIGLSVDESPDHPASFAASHGLAWREGFLGGAEGDSIQKLYGVEGIPSIWLIGPDGTVISKNARGPTLMAELSEALCNS